MRTWRRRVVLGVEQLEYRVVPAGGAGGSGDILIWDASDDGPWNVANNW
jgi:hypothetical protein